MRPSGSASAEIAEAAAARGRPAAGDPGGWVQVAGHLAGPRAGFGFVAKDQAGQAGFIDDRARQGLGAVGVVVAHRPDQLAPHGQSLQPPGLVGRQPGLAAAAHQWPSADTAAHGIPRVGRCAGQPR